MVRDQLQIEKKYFEAQSLEKQNLGMHPWDLMPDSYKLVGTVLKRYNDEDFEKWLHVSGKDVSESRLFNAVWHKAHRWPRVWP